MPVGVNSKKKKSENAGRSTVTQKDSRTEKETCCLASLLNAPLEILLSLKMYQKSVGSSFLGTMEVCVLNGGEVKKISQN